ncbi:MAG: bifunctional 4-hydroxy-2-oxoglutarate aldolase/2-dehydro-3-deoxy-phosphogluconate aldolase [Bacteroidota bacterium]|nr:bifunctional 4-hydroxy-2-oxoglutarate aldolase/2-dehydro-3-deoxy-phosphogluconate aldolase [Bacteroidota bacterium]MDP4229697.1 bifunctional 4-hydroxy-2-oxoglutarate aldolase/2-dehydro-3-deoxy-phosphogluconate aldolase [Bacteroidota bacterium]MDP4237639.1 bifunctional 4-hydroxy-2-oxoglutarate aldolase/2-dehydro-3-deoxy-phosphogluconate aldolase [Bacteroidota bacterium]
MNPNIDRILKAKLIAVLRLKDTTHLLQFAERIVASGISIFEVTLDSGNALECIELLRQKFPQCLIGAGTVIGRKASESAITAGAEFLVSPINDPKMITVAREHAVVSIAGALTPTEAWEAHTNGADFVKIFPLTGLGPSYIKALRGPFKDIRFVATNGVTLENIGEFFEAGISAIGLGSILISDLDVDNGKFDEVGRRAKRAITVLPASGKSSEMVQNKLPKFM